MNRESNNNNKTMNQRKKPKNKCFSSWNEHKDLKIATINMFTKGKKEQIYESGELWHL